MLVEEVFKSVTRQFGDETGAQIDVNDVLRWINEGQLKIQRRTSSSRAVSPPISVIATDNVYTLPTDFFKSISAELDGKRLQIVSEAQLKTLYPDLNSTSAQTGLPKFFNTRSTGLNTAEIVLAPVPAGAGSLIVTYTSRPPIVTSTADELSIPEVYHPTLLTYCLAMAKQLDGDNEAAGMLGQAFQSEVTEDSHDAKHKDDETYPFIRASAADMFGGYM